MTSAHPGHGEDVETTAQLADGREVQGTAWFRADPEAYRLEWGSEGPSGYGGRLEVSPSGEHSRVEVWLHTTRPDGDEQVRDGIDETLANVKRLVEAERVA